MAGQVVVVTGGVASGKTAVTRCFEALGVVVLDADLVARELVEPGQPALAEIIARFGASLVDSHGRLDRPALRERIFSDAEGKRDLEAILHPRIRARLREGCRDAVGEYVVAAVPLLVEGGARSSYPWLDRILVVDAPESLQRQRLQSRDGCSQALAERMVAAQATRPERLAVADDILANDGPLASLEAAILRLDAFYRRKAG